MAEQNQTPTHDARQQNERLRFALQAAEVGTWDLDIVHQQVWWDETCKKLYGFHLDDVVPYDQVLSYMHPDDRPHVDEAVRWALTPQSEGRYDIHFRTIGAEDGQLRWLQCRGRAYFDEQHQPYRFSGTAQDVTQLLQTRHQLKASEARFRDLVMATPAATAIFVGRDMRIQQVNAPMLAIWGKDTSVIGQTLHGAIPELDGQPFLGQLQHVFDTGQPFHHAEGVAELLENGRPKRVWFNHAYNPLFDKDGHIYGVINTAIDVTEQVLARQAVEQSQQQLLALFEEAPVAIALISKDELRFQTANSFYGQLVGRGPDQLIGKPLLEALPELRGQGFDGLLQQVVATGQPYTANEVRVEVVRNGQLETIYVDLTYQPRREATGTISGILVVAVDVTAQVRARQKIEESEARLRSIIASAPAAMGLFVGRDLVVELPNQAFIDIVGKGPHIEGKPLREVMPELISENQPFLRILDEVYTSGKTFQSFGSQVKIVRDGALTDNYYNITYSPLFDPSGQVWALLDIAIDVTGEVQLRQQLQQTEESLREAIELAQLGTWVLDPMGGLVHSSERLRDWSGADESVMSIEHAYESIAPTDQKRIRAAISHALLLQSGGRFDEQYRLVHRQTGQQRMLHALGKTQFDASGKALKLVGTTRDITQQYELHLALEQQVQVRTQELTVAVHDLQRSNDNLQQFAYVASHDLQEPLRKIQSFSTLLSQHLNDRLDEKAHSYLERITRSGARMSTLIKDLLSYSRIATRQQAFDPISLNAVMASVLDTLSLEIEERRARIEVDELPIMNGDGSQLSQLFQNLLANALKFTPLSRPPRVQINYVERGVDELPPEVRPNRAAPFYHQISVSDQGIGFDEKYLDRIFQVFQRLHGKNEFPGTGVGLAICQRVVENHGGAITASSQPGQGATFCVYLPA